MEATIPELSIVIVNSDGLPDTLACLASITASPPRCSYEIILVDNRSRDNCLAEVQARFPAVRAMEAPLRQGFARNYNQGMRAARGAYVVILNNDTLIHPGALDRMREALERNPAYAMVGPRLISPDGGLQTVCARPMLSPARYIASELLTGPGLPSGQLIDMVRRRQLLLRPTGPVPCIVGACMMLRRSDLETIGYLDEGFDFYFEDVEWCHRVWRAGREVAYVADAIITHLGDQSLSKVKVWAKQSEYRSALRYFRAYYRFGLAYESVFWAATTASYLMRGIASLALEIAGGRATHARAYMYLWQWVLRQRPALAGRTGG